MKFKTVKINIEGLLGLSTKITTPKNYLPYCIHVMTFAENQRLFSVNGDKYLEGLNFRSMVAQVYSKYNEHAVMPRASAHSQVSAHAHVPHFKGSM